MLKGCSQGLIGCSRMLLRPGRRSRRSAQLSYRRPSDCKILFFTARNRPAASRMPCGSGAAIVTRLRRRALFTSDYRVAGGATRAHRPSNESLGAGPRARWLESAANPGNTAAGFGDPGCVGAARQDSSPRSGIAWRRSMNSLRVASIWRPRHYNGEGIIWRSTSNRVFK